MKRLRREQRKGIMTKGKIMITITTKPLKWQQETVRKGWMLKEKHSYNGPQPLMSYSLEATVMPQAQPYSSADTQRQARYRALQNVVYPQQIQNNNNPTGFYWSCSIWLIHESQSLPMCLTQPGITIDEQEI